MESVNTVVSPNQPVSAKEVERIKNDYPVKCFRTTVPYGYVKTSREDYALKGGDPNLPLEEGYSVEYLLVPDPVEIGILDSALNQLDNGNTVKDVLAWINSQNPDKQISYAGLYKLWGQYRPNHAKRSAVPKPLAPKVLTPEEREYKKKKALIAAEKKRIAFAKKKQEKLEVELGLRKEIKKTLESDKPIFLDYSPEDYANLQEDEVVFRANPGPQSAFFASSEKQVLYGGAAAGGKSYALIADPIPLFENKHFRGLLVRRTLDELRELMQKTKELYPQVIKGATWREKDKEWRFPSGATLWMSYLGHEDDVTKYQGQAFTWIAFDELTQWPTSLEWNYLSSRLRTTGDIPLYMRATSNPGGVGHAWVKKMFVDPAPAGQAFWAEDENGNILVYPDDEPEAGQPLFQRKFIPAKLADNPYIDKMYKANLLSLPEDQRRQLLYGDWDVATGAAFPEFRRALHVIEPFEIPSDWRRFRSCDFGYSQRQSSAVHWYAIHPSTGQLIVYRELYITGKTGKELALMIKNLERGEHIAYGVLDSSVWAQRGQTGPSIAEEMRQWGVRWRPSDRTQGSRIAGRMRIHELLRVDPLNQKPGLVFFNNCRKIIETLPVIPSDPNYTDDIDQDFVDDHAYDSLRYGVMSRPKHGVFEIMPPINRHTMDFQVLDTKFGY